MIDTIMHFCLKKFVTPKYTVVYYCPNPDLRLLSTGIIICSVHVDPGNPGQVRTF